MQFSLVLASFGRTEELNYFLLSLDQQSHRSFELIVIDQNLDNRLTSIISTYQNHFKIKHLVSEIGLSRARNKGLSHVEGDVIAFPDDDCWYSPNFLEILSRRFDAYQKIDGYTGRTLDERGSSIIRFANQEGYLTKLNAWHRVNSSSMFFRAKVIQDVGWFDEGLGPGSPTSRYSADDVDYVIRCVGKGYRIFYDPDVVTFHEDHRRDGFAKLHERAFQYGAGIGHVWRKHKFPLWYIGYHLLRPFSGMIIAALLGDYAKAKYHQLSLLGRYSGWRSSL